MKVNARFTFDAVQFDKENDVHLVVGLTAPNLSADKKRSPLCIVPVIDISGSMGGQKLAFAKQSEIKLVEQLQPGDYAGLVSFSDEGRVDFYPVEMTQARKDELRAKIAQLHTEGGTNLCDGMMKAVEAAKRLDLPASVLTRVILLTDGQATHGIAKDGPSLCNLLGKIKGHVTLSAFGYGKDPDHTILNGLSTEGAGNYAYIENPDNALAAFGKELGGLLSTYAQNIQIEVTPSNGHVISEVISDLTVDEEVDGEVNIKVPAILAEETNNVVIAVKLAPQKQHGPRQVNAFDIKVTYETLGEDGTPVKKTEETKAKVQFVRPEDIEKTPIKEVDEIVARAQLVKAQFDAEKAADRGDFGTAGAVFQQFQTSVAARGHTAVAGVAGTISHNYAAPVYGATRGRRTALRAATSRGMGVSSLLDQDSALLESAGYSVSNSTQTSSSNAFSGGGAVVMPSDPGVAVDLSSFVVGPVGGSVQVGGGNVGAMWSGGGHPLAPLQVPAPEQVKEAVKEAAQAAKKTLSKSRSKKIW